jgi:hypothetical protein
MPPAGEGVGDDDAVLGVAADGDRLVVYGELAPAVGSLNLEVGGAGHYFGILLMHEHGVKKSSKAWNPNCLRRCAGCVE